MPEAPAGGNGVEAGLGGCEHGNCKLWSGEVFCCHLPTVFDRFQLFKRLLPHLYCSRATIHRSLFPLLIKIAGEVYFLPPSKWTAVPNNGSNFNLVLDKGI